ncbi:TPA: TrbG/VirB9 family P-type conjugative transfer protein [Pseudomonas aeruginosa]
MKLETFFKVSGLALALICSVSANAAELPKGSSYDKRIQYVMYNPDDVVVVKTRAGNSTLIQLEADEYLVNLPTGGLSMGDTGAWTLGVRGNNIFLKPKGPFPNTNINLVTNKRTYAISLVEVEDVKQAAFQVRYRYPAEPVNLAGKGGSGSPVDKGPCSDGPKNTNWFKYGDQTLSPTEVWDDGRFTCMRFPTSKALPLPYRYTPDNELKEALPNFNWKDDVMVIHEVSEEFRLRLGNKVLGIKTDSMRPAPYNRNKTSTGEVRVKLDGE